jgi:DNA primase
MPLLWSEVNSQLDPRAFTIRTAIDRMERLGVDTVVGAIEEKPDLGGVLQELSAVLSVEVSVDPGTDA